MLHKNYIEGLDLKQLEKLNELINMRIAALKNEPFVEMLVVGTESFNDSFFSIDSFEAAYQRLVEIIQSDEYKNFEKGDWSICRYGIQVDRVKSSELQYYLNK